MKLQYKNKTNENRLHISYLFIRCIPLPHLYNMKLIV